MRALLTVPLILAGVVMAGVLAWPTPAIGQSAVVVLQVCKSSDPSDSNCPPSFSIKRTPRLYVILTGLPMGIKFLLDITDANGKLNFAVRGTVRQEPAVGWVNARLVASTGLYKASVLSQDGMHVLAETPFEMTP